MKAAAENVLADWSTGADLTAPLQGLVETAQTFLVGNLLPMIGNVLAGIPELVYTLVPEILQSGTQLVTSLAEGFTQGIPDFLSNALPQLLQFTEELRANAGVFVDAGLNLITQLLNGLIAGLPDLIAYVPDIIINICGVINDNMPKILAQGVSIIVQLIAGLVQTVPSLLANWKKILEAVLSVISAINWLNIGKTILTGVANGVKSMGSSLLNAFKGGFSSALAWIKSLPSQAVQWGKNLIQSFINGLTGQRRCGWCRSLAATAVPPLLNRQRERLVLRLGGRQRRRGRQRPVHGGGGRPGLYQVRGRRHQGGQKRPRPPHRPPRPCCGPCRTQATPTPPTPWAR